MLLRSDESEELLHLDHKSGVLFIDLCRLREPVHEKPVDEALLLNELKKTEVRIDGR